MVGLRDVPLNLIRRKSKSNNGSERNITGLIDDFLVEYASVRGKLGLLIQLGPADTVLGSTVVCYCGFASAQLR